MMMVLVRRSETCCVAALDLSHRLHPDRLARACVRPLRSRPRLLRIVSVGLSSPPLLCLPFLINATTPTGRRPRRRRRCCPHLRQWQLVAPSYASTSPPLPGRCDVSERTA